MEVVEVWVYDDPESGIEIEVAQPGRKGMGTLVVIEQSVLDEFDRATQMLNDACDPIRDALNDARR